MKGGGLFFCIKYKFINIINILKSICFFRIWREGLRNTLEKFFQRMKIEARDTGEVRM